MADAARVGVVGCGAISAAYFGMAKKLPDIEIVACADLLREKAEARAAEFEVPRVCDVDELLGADDIDIVLNLTVPKAHAPIALQALEHGKHTFAEKPLGINRAEGEAILAKAKATGLRVGSAPDTFLGAGVQTARKVIDDGDIGRPVAFTAFMMGRGHEHWHPNPEFYYEVGGGPMFDMGPYYLTALLNMLGPVKQITGGASIAVPERTITSEPKYGKKMTVQTPDHICGTIEFENGVIGTIIMSFAIHFAVNGGVPIMVYGDEGTLMGPDPNGFDGEIKLRRPGDDEWRTVPPAFVTGYGRAIGLADLAHAQRTGRAQRCSLEQSFAVLDLMQGFLDTAASGAAYRPAIQYQRPAPMPADLPFGVLDD